MTSFDQPDSGLLVEHLLPSLLGAHNSLSQDIQTRTLFFGELATGLERLRGRLTTISSPLRGPRDDSQYPWLRRYVDHFNVGSTVRAVQHAKLWALHWKFDDGEALELHVSSTNLSSSAFKFQLQAGWQVTLPLAQRTSQSTRRTWGELIPFLEALGPSAGPEANTRVQRLIELLGRAECPTQVTFVASVPGGKSAARQLAKFEPSEIHLLAPTIGEWNERTLAAWSSDVGVALKMVHLKWISASHPWATGAGWAMSNAARENLQSSGVHLDCLTKDVRFTEQHRDGDARWSHAKLYLLRSRRKRRLLITSANWSVAAWGAGRIAPRNFELGVVFESEWTDLERLGEPFDPPEIIPYCRDHAEDEELMSTLEWGEASWDGSRIAFRARTTDTDVPISATVTFTGGVEESVMLIDGEASMPWNEAERTPLAARFVQGVAVLEVDVLDLRPPSEFTKTPLPEVDPAVERALRDAFLLQRYGGPVVEPESIPGLSGEGRAAGVAGPPADYAVQAWLASRRAFVVVDKWRAALDEAGSDAAHGEQIRRDGEQLRAFFAQSEGPAADLVVEELGWRLNEDA